MRVPAARASACRVSPPPCGVRDAEAASTSTRKSCTLSLDGSAHAERERLGGRARGAARRRSRRRIRARASIAQRVRALFEGPGVDGVDADLLAARRPPLRARAYRRRTTSASFRAWRRSPGRPIASTARATRSYFGRPSARRLPGRSATSDGPATSSSRSACTCRARSISTTRPHAGSSAATSSSGSSRSPSG